MENKLSLFEKITLTLGVINAILFVVGLYCALITKNEDFVLWFVLPLAIQLGLTVILFVIVEIILYRIWGCDIHIFPSLY